MRVGMYVCIYACRMPLSSYIPLATPVPPPGHLTEVLNVLRGVDVHVCFEYACRHASNCGWEGQVSFPLYLLCPVGLRRPPLATLAKGVSERVSGVGGVDGYTAPYIVYVYVFICMCVRKLVCVCTCMPFLPSMMAVRQPVAAFTHCTLVRSVRSVMVRRVTVRQYGDTYVFPHLPLVDFLNRLSSESALMSERGSGSYEGT
jgi:hypothetical protein